MGRIVLPQKENRKTLEEWAGSKHLSLTLVFTDIVESTKIGRRLGDTDWIEDLFLHFSRARELAANYDCYVVKVIGDSLMMAFRAPSDAVKFGVDFSINTGVDYIGIRVAINSGEVQIRENDIYGLNVNFASRVQRAIPREGILVSNSVRRDYDKTMGSSFAIKFLEEEKDLKDFGKEILCRAISPDLRNAWLAQREARFKLLNSSVPRRPRSLR
jgi:class 3 adenylate cyclase